MAIATEPVVRYTPAEAAATVERLRQLAADGFKRQVFSHPLMRELMAGALPLAKVRGFLLNWYRFALEINTVRCDAYNHYLPFFERHPDCYDLLTEQIADELTHPGRGGHIKMLQVAGEALGLAREELVEARLIPEGRALVDSRIRLWREGPMAEAWASSLGEREIGIWMGMWHEALTQHYGLSERAAEYFCKHYEADTQEHEGGIMAHGEGNGYILRRILEDGYRPERPGWDLEYAVRFAVDLYELFLNGVYTRY